MNSPMYGNDDEGRHVLEAERIPALKNRRQKEVHAVVADDHEKVRHRQKEHDRLAESPA